MRATPFIALALSPALTLFGCLDDELDEDDELATDIQGVTTTPGAHKPTADARVRADKPSTNYGGSSVLAARSTSPETWSYLRFSVSGMAGSVTGAKLRLYVYDGTTNAPKVYATSDGWTEDGITWKNKPAPVGPLLADAGSIAAQSWVEYDVSSKVTGNGTYSFVLVPEVDDVLRAYSSEGAVSPELVVTTASATPRPDFSDMCFGSGRSIVNLPDGIQTSSYKVSSPADNTTYDARGTVFRVPEAVYPLTLGASSGGRNTCVIGGDVQGQLHAGITWERAHELNTPCVRLVATGTMVLHGMRCDNQEDGFRPRESSDGANNVAFKVSGTYFTDIHDDCLENDGIIGGVLADSLWDGCNTGISERPAVNQSLSSPPPSGETLTLDHMLIGLKKFVHDDGSVTQNALFKWSSVAHSDAQVIIKCSIFKVDAVSANGTGTMAIRGHVDDSSCAPDDKSTLVWLGGGAYPARVPAGMTVTSDIAVWNRRVARWKCAHGYGCQ